MHALVALDVSNVGVPWRSDSPAYVYISPAMQPVRSKRTSRAPLAIKPVRLSAALIT